MNWLKQSIEFCSFAYLVKRAAARHQRPHGLRVRQAGHQVRELRLRLGAGRRQNGRPCVVVRSGSFGVKPEHVVYTLHVEGDAVS